jgi:hypothetical protein
MKLITKKIEQYRPRPFPCAEILERSKFYLFGVIPINKYTKAFFLLAVVIVLCSLNKCSAQPRNLQVKVIEVLNREKRKVELKCISMQGDTVYVRYGALQSTGNIIPGSRLTIYSNYDDKKCTWYCRRIKLNN